MANLPFNTFVAGLGADSVPAGADLLPVIQSATSKKLSLTALSGFLLPVQGFLTPGSYTNTNLTVNAEGIITAAANGSGGSAAAVGASVQVNATPVSIANNTATAVPFDNVDFDTSGFYNGSFPTLLSAPTGGKYLLSASIQWAAAALPSGKLQAGFITNGFNFLIGAAAIMASSTDTLCLNLSGVVSLAGGNTASVQVLQTTGAALNILNSQQISTFSMMFLGS